MTTATTTARAPYAMRRDEPGSQGARRRYVSEDGRLVVEVSTLRHDRQSRHDLMRLWVRRGLVPGFIGETLHVDAYFTADDGSCVGRYNPCELEGGLGRVVNFARVLEATPANELRLVAECAAMRRDGVAAYRRGDAPCELGDLSCLVAGA